MEPLLIFSNVGAGRLVARRARFTVEIEGEDGRTRLCHLHDPGRLRHLLRRGVRVYYRPVWRPGRRTSCDMVAVDDGDVLVLEDTRVPNLVVPRVIGGPALLPGYRLEAREAQVAGLRVDFVASAPDGKLALVEAKGTNLAVGGAALFPDAPSRRAWRQLEALAASTSAGVEAHVVFVALRPDVDIVAPNRVVDLRFSRLLCSLRGRIRYHGLRLAPVLDVERRRIFVASAEPIPVEPCAAPAGQRGGE